MYALLFGNKPRARQWTLIINRHFSGILTAELMFIINLQCFRAWGNAFLSKLCGREIHWQAWLNLPFQLNYFYSRFALFSVFCSDTYSGRLFNWWLSYNFFVIATGIWNNWHPVMRFFLDLSLQFFLMCCDLLLIVIVL